MKLFPDFGFYVSGELCICHAYRLMFTQLAGSQEKGVFLRLTANVKLLVTPILIYNLRIFQWELSVGYTLM